MTYDRYQIELGVLQNSTIKSISACRAAISAIFLPRIMPDVWDCR